MNQQTPVEVHLLSSLSQISAVDWDACACPEARDNGRPNDPFTTHRFLLALEQSGSVGPETGWQPRYLTAQIGDKIIACAPLYAKSHSQGEYIFDFNWAQAYENAGGNYYPKLQIAVPFTPVSGRRLLAHPDHRKTGRAALIQGAVQIAAENNLSSLHITFCTDEEADAGVQMGLMRRTSQQFHWVNNAYENFDDFLGSLNARKRKNIRKERQTAHDFGLNTGSTGDIIALIGDDIKPEHWAAFWNFYQDTGARKWGTPYLTREFFDLAQAHLRDDILLILASRDGEYVAGALNFIGRNTLYGRYWGAVEDHPCLHFELCYYQAIDYAIAHGLTRVEAGAQGEHKLARGYLPVACHSLHWVGDPGFRDAIAQYLVTEKNAVDHDMEIMTSFGPFRQNDQTEHD